MKTMTDKEFFELIQDERLSYTGIIKWNDGTIEYRKNGKTHREDGPAYETISGYKVWRVNGVLHRLDGPARIYVDGKKFYFLYGKEYTKEQHEQFQDLLKYKKLP